MTIYYDHAQDKYAKVERDGEWHIHPIGFPEKSCSVSHRAFQSLIKSGALELHEQERNV